MKEHHFLIEDAITHGVEKAILLYNIRYWLTKNKENNTNNLDGYYWTFNSATAYSNLFPYLSKRSISRWLNQLEEDGYLLSTYKYNKFGADKTKWYTIPSEFKVCNQNDLPICQNDQPKGQNGTPIPDSKQQIVNTDKKEKNKNKKEKSALSDLVFCVMSGNKPKQQKSIYGILKAAKPSDVLLDDIYLLLKHQQNTLKLQSGVKRSELNAAIDEAMHKDSKRFIFCSVRAEYDFNPSYNGV